MWFIFFLISVLASLFVAADFDKALSSSCFNHQGNLICYDVNDPLPDMKNTIKSIATLESKHVKENAGLDDEELSKARTSCNIALKADYKLTLAENRSVPVILFQPRYCVGFGNQLGFAFELMSFALIHGIPFVRVDKHDNFPIHQCSDMKDSRPMLKSLPKFVIPLVIRDALTSDLCNSIPEWPWESTSPYFFRNIPILSIINNAMVSSYHQKTQSLNHQRRDIPRLLSNSLTIHFRCSDNLAHSSMGLLPYSDYNKTLSMIAKHNQFRIAVSTAHGDHGIKSVVIYTDTNLYKSHGAICTRALAELESLISAHPRLSTLDIIVHRTTTIKTYVMMHLSRFLLCSASTLCFFSALGHDHAYIPSGSGIVIKQPNFPFESNFTFVQTRMIRPRKETMHPDDFAKDFLIT